MLRRRAPDVQGSVSIRGGSTWLPHMRTVFPSHDADAAVSRPSVVLEGEGGA